MRVKKRNPFHTPRITRPGDRSRYPLLLLPLILLWLGTSWLSFDYGRERAGFDSGKAAERLQQVRGELSILQREREQMKRQMVNLESENKIHKVVQAELQASLKQLQNERLVLEKKLLFMRGVQSGELDNAVLEVRELKTWPVATNGDFRISFTITQAMGKQPVVQGTIKLMLRGMDKSGATVELPFAEIVQGKLRTRMNFKHFQKVEWDYRVPKDFEPTAWRIQLQPESERITPYEQDFAWRSAD